MYYVDFQFHFDVWVSSLMQQEEDFSLTLS